MTAGEHNQEREDPRADSALIDPGPIPGVGARGTYQRQLEKALTRSAPKPGSMRRGVDR